MSIDLNAPEVQDAIKKAVETAVEAATKPLVDKRDELLGEVKKLRKESAIKPEDLEAIEKERDDLKAALTTAQKEAKTFAEAAKKADEALKTEATFNHRLLVDNGLTDELTKVGVTNPAFLKAVKSTLASQIAVVVDGDKRIAKAGDKPLADFVKEWAGSDEGKHFVSAPNNSGGGGLGGNGGGTDTSKLTSTQRIAEGLKKLT
jgi:chromosome segregation ATPase